MPKNFDQRRAVRDLLGVWESHIESDTAFLTPDVPFEASLVIRSLAAHAVDNARGVLQLFDASFPVAAVPLVRTLIEDAVLASWLLRNPDRTEAVVLHGAQKRLPLIEDALSVEPGNPVLLQRRAEYQAKVAEMKRKGVKGLPTIEGQVRSIPGTGALYMHYRWASAFAHAGAHTVELYTAFNSGSDGASSAAHWRPSAQTRTASTFLTTAAMCLLRALLAWDQCLHEHAYRQDLEAIASRMGFALVDDDDLEQS